jgi:hypothetical protein
MNWQVLLVMCYSSYRLRLLVVVPLAGTAPEGLASDVTQGHAVQCGRMHVIRLRNHAKGPRIVAAYMPGERECML